MRSLWSCQGSKQPMNNNNTLPSTIPTDVAQTLSHLANLIDAGLQVRASTETPRAFAARHFGVPITDVSAEERPADYYEFFSVGRAAVELMDGSVVSATMGHSSDVPPTWGSVGSGGNAVRHPLPCSPQSTTHSSRHRSCSGLRRTIKGGLSRYFTHRVTQRSERRCLNTYGSDLPRWRIPSKVLCFQLPGDGAPASRSGSRNIGRSIGRA